MVALSTLFVNHPVAKGAEDLLTISRDLVEEATETVARLDRAWISTAVGSKQGDEFDRLQKLRPRDFGPTQADLVTKLSFRGKRDREEGDEDDGNRDSGTIKKRSNSLKRIPPAQWAKMTEAEKKAFIEKRKKK
jgi:hypothetical protein